MNPKNPARIAICDDHAIIVSGLELMINKFDNCKVIFTATSAPEAIEKMTSWTVPDVLILDICMPGMDGFEACSILNEKYPELKILILTMFDGDLNVIRALKLGVKGFLKKTTTPDELELAIEAIMTGHHYYNQYTSGRIFDFLSEQHNKTNIDKILLTEREIKFLKLACSDMPYKAIHQELNVSPRAGEKIREELFFKLDVTSRVGLAIYAIKHGMVSI